ncbi:MAG: hypothetical protein ABI690_28790 [Chloroflexota bacterium]
MFWIGGIWDKRVQHKVVGFSGLMLLFIIGHVAAVITGAPFASRFLF